MASNEITFTLKINDKGNLEGIAQKAKKGAKGLDNVGKSARDADRNLKGAAQASSNTTKNFSKMAQGMDSMLVPAYAAFAAQVFALTAVFGFFKRAGDLQVLQQGQIAYASATGLAMKSLTKDIMEATGGQVAFTEAASAAAIGTAAGLSTDQLERLGKAAKDTSAVLGRDVTDSFNRLVRGVTKAEPELLDELGIILRLDNASRKYKEALNITGRELTTFEKSQAVANDVLEQSEQKYSRILDIVGDGSVNEFNKLAVAIDEITMKIQKALVPVASTLARVLTEVPVLAGAAFALFLSGPLKAMGFTFSSLGIQSKEASDQIIAGVKQQKLEFEQAQATLARYRNLLAGTPAMAAGASGTAFDNLRQGKDLDKKDIGIVKGQITKSLKQFDKDPNLDVVQGKGDFAGFTKQQLLDTQANLNSYDVSQKKAAASTVASTSRMKIGFNGVKASIQGMAAGAAAAASKVLMAFGWIGIITTAVLMLKDAFTMDKVLTDDEKAANRLKEKIKDLNSELEKFVLVQKEIFKEGGTGADLNRLAAGIAQQSSALTAGQMTEQVGLAASGAPKEVVRQTRRGARKRGRATDEEKSAIKLIDRQKESLALLIKEGALLGSNQIAATNYLNALASGDADEISKTKAAFDAQGKIVAEFPRLMKDSISANKNFINSLAPMNKTEQAMSTLNAELTKLKEISGEAVDEDGNALPVLQTLTTEQKKRKLELEGQLDLMKRINEQAHKEKIASLESAQRMEAANAIRHPVEKAIAVAKEKQRQQDDLISNKIQEIMNHAEATKDAEGDTAEIALRRNQILNLELQGLQQKGKILTDEVTRKEKLKQIELDLYNLQTDNKITNASKAALDATTKDITARKKKLDLEEKTRRMELEREIAGMERDAPLDKDAIERKRADLELKLAQDFRQSRIDIIEEERKAKQAALVLEYQLLDAKLLQTELEMQKLALDETITKDQKTAAEKALLAIQLARGNLSVTQATESANIDTEASQATDKVDDDIQKAKDAKTALSEAEQQALEFGKTMQSSMESAFMSMVDGSKSAKQAFTDMAQQILKMIAKMIIEMLVLKALQAMGIPGFGDGGVAEKARSGGMFGGGRKMPGYSSGGIASGSNAGYPVMLHGTEAVVPLPNNREIPVEMKGAAGQVNNVSVSVSVANDGQSNTSVSGTGQNSMGKGLGEAISAAVVSELAKQKRNGGMLSPYGAA